MRSQQKRRSLATPEYIVRDPLRSTGWVIEQTAHGLRFRGTCFGYGGRGVLLTAAHCVRDIPIERLTVGIWNAPVDLGRATQGGLGPQQPGIEIAAVERHEFADLAVMKIDDFSGVFERFEGIRSECNFGDELAAFGYPEDTAEDGIEPTPRMFRGFLQRTYHHASHQRYQYDAGELSFGAPGGLSGGPVTVWTDPANVLGVVAENRRSSTYLETTESVDHGDNHFRSETHSVINYGICVLLAPLKEWLDLKARPLAHLAATDDAGG